MNLPGFTAEAAVYSTSRHYRASGLGFSEPPSSDSVMLALTPEGAARCDDCELTAATDYTYCMVKASGLYTVGALACLGIVFPPAVAFCETAVALTYAGASAWCLGESYYRLWNCHQPGHACCPVACVGGDCCSEGETCTPYGCCPRGQAVCGGRCCAPGENCCGDTCCPPYYYCWGGVFCEPYPDTGLWPKDWDPSKRKPTPKNPQVFNPSIRYCHEGETPCGEECCPPGLQCCYDIWTNSMECKPTCLH